MRSASHEPFDVVPERADIPIPTSDFLGRAANSRRVSVAFGVLLLAAFLLLMRAIDVQVLQGAALRATAESNRSRDSIIVPTRGELRDRSGVVLARNEARYAIGVIPADLPRGEARTHASAALSTVLHTDAGALSELLRQYPEHLSEAVVVREFDTYADAAVVYAATRAVPGVVLVPVERRIYGTPTGIELESLGHLLGTVGRLDAREYAKRQGDRYRPSDATGTSGVERAYEQVLRGKPGLRMVTVDAFGRTVATTSSEDAVAGEALTLTIDHALQARAESALREGLRRVGARRGAVVLLEPTTGAIRALVSLPGFSASALSVGIPHEEYARLVNNPDQPLFPRAIAGTYPSGSTIKPFIAAAALSRGVITERTRLLSTGGIAVEQSFFPDWKDGGHGWVNVRDALAYSVNTFFYLIGGGKPRAAPASMVGPSQEEALGIDGIVEVLRAFGLGLITGVDVAGEAVGLVPSPAWKRTARGEEWFIGDTYHVSIGQGDVLVTPLQLAVAIAALANGGTPVQPHAVAHDGYQRASRPVAGVTAEAIAVVRRGLRDAVLRGSAAALADFPFPVYGKTGTAEWRRGKQPHAWFVGFAEQETGNKMQETRNKGQETRDRRQETGDERQETGSRGEEGESGIVIAVLVEEGGEGSRTAVPIAKEVLRGWAATGTDGAV